MVDKISGCQDNFTVARYKQELAKPYSKAYLFICKEADFKADSEMNDVSDFVEEKPLIDLPSNDDSIFDRSVLDIAQQVPSSAANTATKLDERMVTYNTWKTVSILPWPLLR